MGLLPSLNLSTGSSIVDEMVDAGRDSSSSRSASISSTVYGMDLTGCGRYSDPEIFYLRKKLMSIMFAYPFHIM